MRSIPKFNFFSIILYCIITVSCIPQTENENNENTIRTKTNINQDWLYLENPTKNISEVALSKDWTPINLPHTWNREDVTDLQPGYRRNASWYKKELVFQDIPSDKKYLLYFEGANITTKVYINGTYAGEHIGGYIGFEIDITPHIVKGTNELLIRVDNSYNPDVIPSQKSDFFIYGGITRDVWLRTLPDNHINTVKITTPKVSEKLASLQLLTTLSRPKTDRSQKLQIFIRNPEGKTVASKVLDIEKSEVTFTFKDIKNPKLWDIQDPNLYMVDIVLLEDEKIIDKVSQSVGFRWFEFKDYGPFYLNGKRLLLRGTHRHEEHAGFGAAMPNKLHRKDMELIKEMGANFVRLAHYPQDPEIYKACDELGLLVWDELPWCRGGVGGETWKTNTRNLLTEMISQNYNHPSIIIWSLGNEIYWLPDVEGGDNTEVLNDFLEELNTVAHQMDPYRKTALRKYYEGAAIVDVFSPSIWSGWYSGNYKNYQNAIHTYIKKYPHFLHVEYGGSSHVGRHSENPISGEGIIAYDGWEEAIVQTKVANIAKIGDWSENYIVDLFDWYLRISETTPSFTGNIQWAFKDFGTPLRPENDIPYINQKGLVDRNGVPKDAFYVFKSYWSTIPFVYIESHTWTVRQGPKDLARNISVFSNCQQVTLYHNGENKGTKSKNIQEFPASGLNWDITFTQGNNQLIAIAHSDKETNIKDTLNVRYRYTKNDSAKELKLSYEKLTNGNYLITAIAVDKNGLRCLDYEQKAYFQCLEGGKTIKNQGTPTGSESIAMANGKASIEVIPDTNIEYTTVMVFNQNFKGTYVTIPQ